LRDAILSHDITFAIGPAGTGKTAVATFVALELLDKRTKNGGVDSILATRPLVTSGPSPGALPGDLREKVDPYLRAIYDLIRVSNHPRSQELLHPREDKAAELEGIPVEMLRGLTFDDKFVILDEAQNVTIPQMEMVMTRLGHNSKLVITGDVNQCDLPRQVMSGLAHAVDLFRNNPKFGLVQFQVEDVQRADIVGDVIRAYAKSRERNAA
jgi:phosphate starvation-inducible PhoH-like protein